MDSSKLKELAKRYLLPLFSETKITGPYHSGSDQDVVSVRPGGLIVTFKVNKNDREKIGLQRSQKFTGEERSIVGSFIKVLKEIDPALQDEASAYSEDVLASLQRRIVSRTISGDDNQLYGVISKSIRQLSLWETQLYEGKPVTSAFGFMPQQTSGGYAITLNELCNEALDFSKVIGNGFDTMYEFDYAGNLLGHKSLDLKIEIEYSPYRYGAMAGWTMQGGVGENPGSRIAIVLNRQGEILVFGSGKLLFARRSGYWHCLTHEAFLKQMGFIRDVEVRKKVYESCLDVSFARTGACIGIVNHASRNDWRKPVKESDVLVSNASVVGAPLSDKIKALNTIIGEKKFQQLDRRLRQELLAIDGATLLDHQGKILCVGAILKIGAGSSGGGREAAAKKVSKLGLGVKVSQDGGILVFKDGDRKFSIMKRD